MGRIIKKEKEERDGTDRTEGSVQKAWSKRVQAKHKLFIDHREKAFTHTPIKSFSRTAVVRVIDVSNALKQQRHITS